MDVLDATDVVEEKLMELRVQGIRNSGRELMPIGECHWCGEPFEVDSQRLFCPSAEGGPSECALEWERFK